MKNEFELAFNEIKNQRALSQDVILEALKSALIFAYRRYSGASAAQAIDATIDPTTGRTRIMVEKEVVTDVENPLTEVSLEKARFYNPEAQLNDMVMVQVEGTTKKFGRIAAQTAKQVILQKIREAERESLYKEFREREGDIVTGTVQNMNNGIVTLSLGRAEAMMPRAHQISKERYRQNEKLRVYVLEVKSSNKGPQIIVSRTHRNMLKRLLEFEVPEIYNGQVEIKSIAREAGYRSKVAVAALQEGIDPVGACVGMRGMRIQNIVRELAEEKIDVIEWQADAKLFISKALSPARVTGVYLDDDPEMGRTAVVIVPDDQLSLAIGREGQNARLAAKLTSWRIDIKSEMEAVTTAIENIHEDPFSRLFDRHATLVEEVQYILQKRAENRAIMPEDYKRISKFADLAEKVLIEYREEDRAARQAEIEAVKMTVPASLFDVPMEKLKVSKPIYEKLVHLENIGEVMWRFLIDESQVMNMLRGLQPASFDELKQALDDVMMAAMTDSLDMLEQSDDVVDDVVADDIEESIDDEVEVEEIDDIDEDSFEDDDKIEDESADVEMDVDQLPAAFPVLEDEGEDESEEMKAARRRAKAKQRLAEPAEDFDEDFDDEDDESGRSRKKNKRKRRTLVYDEDAGRVVSKRKRKGSRSQNDWEDFID